jgi:iron complex transport system ATP-binding protein
MNQTGQEILKIQSLLIGYYARRRPLPLLPPLDASASTGELVALLGRNGIGKSTLLRSIAGLQKPLGGSVTINNEETAGFSRFKFAKNVGYISTDIVKVSHMRVYDLVALGRFPHTNWIGKIDRHTDLIIRESIAKAGLAGFENRLVSELSDGERQRTMISRVLAQDTDIMIMDEPMAFLDISGKYGVISLMKELTSGGRTIIFSTHDFNIAVSQADKIWLITATGMITGAPEDLTLGNHFDCLFDPALTGFNPEDGSFDLKSASLSLIHIEGEESRVRKLTIKALKRAGYTVTDEMIIPRIKLPSGKNEWILYTEGTTANCKTLYDLVKRLKELAQVRLSMTNTR